jgi:hypothetical protein
VSDERTSITGMTSSEFISFATEVARSTSSWEAASDVFPGRPRWDGASEGDAPLTRAPESESAQVSEPRAS